MPIPLIPIAVALSGLAVAAILNDDEKKSVDLDDWDAQAKIIENQKHNRKIKREIKQFVEQEVDRLENKYHVKISIQNLSVENQKLVFLNNKKSLLNSQIQEIKNLRS